VPWNIIAAPESAHNPALPVHNSARCCTRDEARGQCCQPESNKYPARNQAENSLACPRAIETSLQVWNLGGRGVLLPFSSGVAALRTAGVSFRLEH
jgi:hypothetical protein